MLSALLGNTSIDKQKALQIPTVAGCLEKISGTIAKLPIKLYRHNSDGTVEEVEHNNRIKLLNDETGDTLNSNEFWRAMVEDYFFSENGAFAYINKEKGTVKSLHYINSSAVTVLNNSDNIFKDYKVCVDGKDYLPFQFLKLKRKTKDGSTNVPLQAESSEIFEVAYATLLYEKLLVQKGGNKRGFIEANDGVRLSAEAITSIKDAWKNLYSNNTDNIVVLNGAKFRESSNTSVEMQLNENKKNNAIEICKLFGIPHTILNGGATDSDVKQFNNAIINILTAIETSLDRDFLLEKEKSLYYWAFDTRELTRGNVKERFDAYEIALRSNFMQLDEVRKQEDLKPLGFNFLKLGLGDILLDPVTKQVYTPNTNQTVELENK